MTKRVGTSPSKPVWLRGAGVASGGRRVTSMGRGARRGHHTARAENATRVARGRRPGGRVRAVVPQRVHRPRERRNGRRMRVREATPPARFHVRDVRERQAEWTATDVGPAGAGGRLAAAGGHSSPGLRWRPRGTPGSHRTARWPCVRYAPRGSYFQGSDENEVAGSYVGPWNSTRCQREHLSARAWLANLLPGASRSRWWACPCRIRRGSCHQPQGSR